MKALHGVVSSACYASLLVATATASAPPTFDIHFGNNGVAALSGGNIETIYTLPSGGVVVAGSLAQLNAELTLHVTRLTHDGQLDPTFGTAGRVLVESPILCRGRLLAAGQPDGAIAASVGGGYPAQAPGGGLGCSEVTGRHSFRLGASGDPIQGFTPAFQLPDRSNPSDALVARADGRLVHATVISSSSASAPTVVVDQTLPDGRPDSQFGANGRTVLAIPNDGVSRNVALALPPDGALLVAVLTTKGLFVYKLDAFGRLVPEFGTTGVFTFAGVFTSATAAARVVGIGILPDASIYLQFLATTPSDVDLIVKALRLSPTGTLRSTLTLPPDTSPALFAVLADDSIVIAGIQGNDFRTMVKLRRLLPDGTLDATFGLRGAFVVPDLGSPRGLAVAPDGKLIVGGFNASDPGSSLVRLNINNAIAPAPVAAIDPYYSGTYSLTNLGTIAGVPFDYGGLVFKAGDPSTILIGGTANSLGGRFYEVPVIRGAGNHIVSFGTPVERGFGANNDAGIAYGPGGVLFYSKFGENAVGQVKPGSNTDDKTVALGALGIAASTGGLTFVPPFYNGAGQFKVSSWPDGTLHTVTLAADGSGTYNLAGAKREFLFFQGGSEGFAYVPLGSPLFDSQSMLASEFSTGNVVAYRIDANGNPLPVSRRTFVAGVPGALGATIDPLTGDFLFSTFGDAANIGGSNRVFAVRGFKSPSAATVDVVEFYNAVLDHYFLTWNAAEIANLDAGGTPTKWDRTGVTFKIYTSAQADRSPVCRYYIPPGLGDSHFFGRGTVECDATGRDNPRFVLEEREFMFVVLPVAGACPPGTIPVYRVFSNRPDANHRYMIDPALRDQMVARGWLAEGDGPDRVVMCVPAA